MVIEIPDKILLKKDVEPEVRLAIAVVLFNNGWLTLESAVRLSGSTRSAFEKAIAGKDAVHLPEPGSGYLGRPPETDDFILAELAKPTKKGFDFESIVKEQGYLGPNKSRIGKIVRELDVQEPLAELLASLSK